MGSTKTEFLTELRQWDTTRLNKSMKINKSPKRNPGNLIEKTGVYMYNGVHLSVKMDAEALYELTLLISKID